jgi:hypothetical protein
MATQTAPSLDDIQAALAALTTQIAQLKTTPEPAKRAPVNSTAAERIRQYVLKHQFATMPELQKALGLEKTSAHYYTQQLGCNAAIRVVYEPHEASHSWVKVACRMDYDVRELGPELARRAEARTGTGG